MAKPNYQYEKRQRDIAKKQKKEEKRLRKAEANKPAPGSASDPSVDANPTGPDEPTPTASSS